MATQLFVERDVYGKPERKYFVFKQISDTEIERVLIWDNGKGWYKSRKDTFRFRANTHDNKYTRKLKGKGVWVGAGEDEGWLATIVKLDAPNTLPNTQDLLRLLKEI